MIVGDLNVQRISGFPLKADSKFIVDPNTELALAVELQRLEPVTGWHARRPAASINRASAAPAESDAEGISWISRPTKADASRNRGSS